MNWPVIGDLRRNTPSLLFTAAFALYALAPAAVYFLPDNSTGLIAAQACRQSPPALRTALTSSA